MRGRNSLVGFEPCLVGGTRGSWHLTPSGTLLRPLRNAQIFSTSTLTLFFFFFFFLAFLAKIPHTMLHLVWFNIKCCYARGVKSTFCRNLNNSCQKCCWSLKLSVYLRRFFKCNFDSLVMHSAPSLYPALHAFIFMVSWKADIVKMWTEHMLVPAVWILRRRHYLCKYKPYLPNIGQANNSYFQWGAKPSNQRWRLWCIISLSLIKTMWKRLQSERAPAIT